MGDAFMSRRDGLKLVHESHDKTGVLFQQNSPLKLSVASFGALEGATVFILIDHSSTYYGYAVIKNFGVNGYVEYAKWNSDNYTDAYYHKTVENGAITISDGYYNLGIFQSFALDNGTPYIFAYK